MLYMGPCMEFQPELKQFMSLTHMLMCNLFSSKTINTCHTYYCRMFPSFIIENN